MFYEALGGEFIRTREVEIGGKMLKELGYGWKSFESAIVRSRERMERHVRSGDDFALTPCLRC